MGNSAGFGATEGSKHEHPTSRTLRTPSSRATETANRVGDLGATTVPDFPLESMVQWIMAQQQRVQGRPTRALSLARPLSTSEYELWASPPMSPRTRLSSISSLQLPFFTNAASARRFSHDIPTKPSSATADAPVPFWTFFRASSTSSLGSLTSLSPTVNGDGVYHFQLDHHTDSGTFDSIDTDTTMPGTTLGTPALDGVRMASSSSTCFANPTFDSAVESTTGLLGTGQSWRPQTSKSAWSTHSSHLLFARWIRRHQSHQLDTAADEVTNGFETRSSDADKQPIAQEDMGLPKRNPSFQKRPYGMAPQLTREEFEGLPLAIQRKYFSTLERLRFAQDAGAVDGISQHYSDISAHNAKRRRARQDRSASEHIDSRTRRYSLRGTKLPLHERQQLANLPDKIKRSQFTREERDCLAKELRQSVILDATDEAVYKLGRRASRYLVAEAELLSPTTISSERSSMDSQHRPSDEQMRESVYNTFRWLEDEDELDLRLFLDDYHANLREEIKVPTKDCRPSFRRHLSISKIPFGRSSISSSRPATKEASSPVQVSPSQSPLGTSAGTFGHSRRKSRALSLIAPRHGAQNSMSGFDPAAAHYQDPDARLKLRVYLASAQKFDEAIEFGFPSMDATSGAPAVGIDNRPLNKRLSRQQLSSDVNMRTFLADDDDDEKMSLNSDPASVADPDSPRTPENFEAKPSLRPLGISADDHLFKAAEAGYPQVPASSREMTLRMTLTRPDLRANEDQIYGWQAKSAHASRRSLNWSSGMEPPVTAYMGDSQPKESMEKMFAGIDHWNATAGTERGVMKRIWNRVRRS